MKEETNERLRARVRDVPDFPKPGIVFKDICPVLADPWAFQSAVDAMVEPFLDDRIDVVLAVESRGFLFGAPIALKLGAALVPVRKPGKLPHQTVRVEYTLEYGTDALEMHTDAFDGGKRVLLVDDVLATGGTASAAVKLARDHGAEVLGASFFLGLDFLGGAEKLAPLRVACALRY